MGWSSPFLIWIGWMRKFSAEAKNLPFWDGVNHRITWMRSEAINFRDSHSTLITFFQLLPWIDQLPTWLNQLLQKVTRLLDGSFNLWDYRPTCTRFNQLPKLPLNISHAQSTFNLHQSTFDVSQSTFAEGHATFYLFAQLFFFKKKVFYFCRKPSNNFTLSIVYISLDIASYLFLICVLPGNWMSNAKSAYTVYYLSKGSLAANNQQLFSDVRASTFFRNHDISRNRIFSPSPIFCIRGSVRLT